MENKNFEKLTSALVYWDNVTRVRCVSVYVCTCVWMNGTDQRELTMDSVRRLATNVERPEGSREFFEIISAFGPMMRG